MKTFLLPVDFSAGTLSACKHALHLSGKVKTKLFLFHIYPDQFIVSDSSIPVGLDSDAFFNAEFIESLRSQAEDNMLKLKDDIFEMAGNDSRHIEIEHLVTGGDPEWEIRAICDEIKPELIIMSTEGEGGKGILEGSMAVKIMNKSKVPVLAVPGSFTKDRLQNIMYPTNFCEADDASINKVFEILKQRNIVMHIVHFILDENDDKCKISMETLSQGFNKKRLEGKITFNLIPTTDKSDVLSAFTEKYKIDMIAFLSHKKNFFQSLFSHKINKKDFVKLKLPLLAFHE